MSKNYLTRAAAGTKLNTFIPGTNQNMFVKKSELVGKCDETNLTKYNLNDYVTDNDITKKIPTFTNIHCIVLVADMYQFEIPEYVRQFRMVGLSITSNDGIFTQSLPVTDEWFARGGPDVTQFYTQIEGEIVCTSQEMWDAFTQQEILYLDIYFQTRNINEQGQENSECNTLTLEVNDPAAPPAITSLPFCDGLQLYAQIEVFNPMRPNQPDPKKEQYYFISIRR